ncbi:hypothetical protein HYH03_008081 [Edaphochlamys debaryana]|uniref:Uncharacterized protein n=1 Tax=Edaphochlamys debaryana TaxID=47281 RepID=A0A835Y7J5_9CHLO|nr:hypothetical protein HYH03_008081 [Edaphochlamys debaryana]|eukprot:KAG2493865.1 hypothetical protein HYH03_008081 [Edaphochlamys debaryana]
MLRKHEPLTDRDLHKHPNFAAAAAAAAKGRYEDMRRVLQEAGHEDDPLAEATQGVKTEMAKAVEEDQTTRAMSEMLRTMMRQIARAPPALLQMSHLVNRLYGDMPAGLEDKISRALAARFALADTLLKVAEALQEAQITSHACQTQCLELVQAWNGQAKAQHPVHPAAAAGEGGEAHEDVAAGAPGDEEEQVEAEVQIAHPVARRSSSGSCTIAFQPQEEGTVENTAEEVISDEEPAQLQEEDTEAGTPEAEAEMGRMFKEPKAGMGITIFATPPAEGGKGMPAPVPVPFELTLKKSGKGQWHVTGVTALCKAVRREPAGTVEAGGKKKKAVDISGAYSVWRDTNGGLHLIKAP